MPFVFPSMLVLCVLSQALELGSIPLFVRIKDESKNFLKSKIASLFAVYCKVSYFVRSQLGSAIPALCSSRGRS